MSTAAAAEWGPSCVGTAGFMDGKWTFSTSKFASTAAVTGTASASAAASSTPAAMTLPLNVEGLKSEGNAAFLSANFTVAALRYTDAIAAALQFGPPSRGGDNDSDRSGRRRGEVVTRQGLSLLYSNRAAALVKARSATNFADAVRDSEEALAWNPDNWKAQLWRAEALQVRGFCTGLLPTILFGSLLSSDC